MTGLCSSCQQLHLRDNKILHVVAASHYSFSNFKGNLSSILFVMRKLVLKVNDKGTGVLKIKDFPEDVCLMKKQKKDA